MSIIINGKVLGGTKNMGELKKFDDLRKEEQNRVGIIEIETTSTDVIILPTEETSVEVHLKGEVWLDGKVSFNVKEYARILKVEANISGISYSGDLKLYVRIPNKMIHMLQQISIKTASGDVTVEKDIFVSKLIIETASGDIKSDANFFNMRAKTMSGDIELNKLAKSDTHIKLKTMSGDVIARFGNVKELELSEDTMSGRVENTHKEAKEGYFAEVDIDSMSGDITVGNLRR